LHGPSRVVIQADASGTLGNKLKQYPGDLVLIGIGQLSNLQDRVFQQLRHCATVAPKRAVQQQAAGERRKGPVRLVCLHVRCYLTNYMVRTQAMDTVSVAEAKARLSELVARAADGETVQITRRGKPVAQLTPIREPRKPIDITLLRAVTDSMPMQPESAGEFIRRMRDDSRY